MLQITEKSQCNGCHACASICPKQCIAMTEDKEGFWYPKIDGERCIDCGRCDKVCPVVNETGERTEKLPSAYAAYAKEDSLRGKSSSGGLFTLIAVHILEQGGVVYGAAWSEDCRSVSHIRVEDASDLYRLRGSKYVQSRIGKAYEQVKSDLAAGRMVLFSGTPCQVGGLYAYLGKGDPHLLTQDLACHGVPMPKVWEKYVEAREAEAGAKVKSVSFRNKQQGWKSYRVDWEFENGKRYTKPFSEDVYMKGFLKNLYLRPSCHRCAFKGMTRRADITLADFWGVQRVAPQMDDDKGTSLVLLHSDKGRKLWESIQDALVWQQVDPREAVQYNPAIVASVEQNKNREKFLAQLDDPNWMDLVESYCRESLTHKVKRKVSKGLSKAKRTLTGGK